MLIIGIDPGAKGGIAIIPLFSFHTTKVIAIEHYTLYQISAMFKEFRYGSEDISDQEYRRDTQVEVYLEEPSLPKFTNKNKKGSDQKFQFSSTAHRELGRSLGQLEGLCIAMNWTVNTLSPQKWQNALGCQSGGDKNVTKSFAEAAFPFLTRTTNGGKVSSSITHGTADALLIALYGYLQYATMVPSSVRHTLNSKLVTQVEQNNGKPIRQLDQPKRPAIPNVARPPSTPRSAGSPPSTGTKRTVPCKPIRRIYPS